MEPYRQAYGMSLSGTLQVSQLEEIPVPEREETYRIGDGVPKSLRTGAWKHKIPRKHLFTLRYLDDILPTQVTTLHHAGTREVTWSMEHGCGKEVFEHRTIPRYI